MELLLQLAGAVSLGLFGGLHCIGMCGGIAVALGSALPRQRVVTGQLVYSAGRVTSYAVAGAIAGGLGFTLLAWLGDTGVLALRVLAGAFLIAAGLTLAGWWSGLDRVERWGSHLWRRIAPLARRIGPADSLGRMWLLGALWGWLPCGLVYAALAGALAAGGPVEGALFMAGFGIGTLPAMVATGAASGAVLRAPLARSFASLLVVGFGIFMIGAAAWSGISNRAATEGHRHGVWCGSGEDALAGQPATWSDTAEEAL